jgi:16S rRNA (cytosine967-C5)-methyltransferase
MIGFSSPYFQKQLKISFEIIDNFSFNEPFHIYLKKKFQQNKNWGSKDRKNYRNICYTILRNYPLLKDLNIENRIQTFQNIADGDLKFNAFDELAAYIDPSINSEEVNQSFNHIAPVFFMPYSKPEFLERLDLSKLIGYVGQIIETDSFIFDGSSNLDQFVTEKLGYIQDYSSTAAIKRISKYCNDAVVWDACCASGGKSLSVLKFSKPKRHYCSDIRPEIIKNLKTRFELSPYELPETFVLDAHNSSNRDIKFDNQKNIIIADLPCTGSGNWRRNPENRWTFNESTLVKYQELQRSIFSSLYSKLPIGGYLYYMTCSIFLAENQGNIRHLQAKHAGLKVEFQEYVGGKIEYNSTGIYSDYIFGCLVQKTQ